MKKFFYILFLFCSTTQFVFAENFSRDSEKTLSSARKLWKALPIQHQGRVKPFDTFSREILRTVYGKESYKKRSAVEVILSWLVIPDVWEKTDLILVEKEIKNYLGFSLKRKHFQPSELKSNRKLALQIAELQSLREKEERLDSYFQKLEKLETRLILYSAVQSGLLIRMESQKNKAWLSLPEMTDPAKRQFKVVLSKYVHLISDSLAFSTVIESLKETGQLGQKVKPSTQEKNKASTAKKDSYKKSLSENKTAFKSFKKEMTTFQNLVFGSTQKSYKIPVEVFYNSLKPFQKAWIFYFLFLLGWLMFSVFQRTDYFKWLFPLSAIGFAFHSLGMILRSYIMSRPPVTNMYETVILVPWSALIAGFVFYLRGYKLPFPASVILAFFCLLLTSLAPEILSASLQPLEAVLRSTFWLSTHVLVITMSYSFFFLAFVLGDMALISYLTNKKSPLALLEKLYNPIYRSIQWGVVLLAVGTILGGIWADYSWGRFWGWDPKESWALVSLLAYLALLHGKLLGWIRAFGMAVGSVMMFFSVIMAWYGVNFVLGAGLHSYGFGSGGLEYVASFLLLHLILCAGAGFKKWKS